MELPNDKVLMPEVLMVMRDHHTKTLNDQTVEKLLIKRSDLNKELMYGNDNIVRDGVLIKNPQMTIEEPLKVVKEYYEKIKQELHENSHTNYSIYIGRHYNLKTSINGSIVVHIRVIITTHTYSTEQTPHNTWNYIKII